MDDPLGTKQHQWSCLMHQFLLQKEEKKLGRCRTGVAVKVFFNVVKASRASVFHVNVDNCSKFVSREARVAY